MRDAVKGTLIIAGVLVIVLGGWFIGQEFTRHTADFRGKTSQINKVQGNGDYRIAAYDHFYDSCFSARADQKNITNTKVALKQAKKTGDSQAIYVQQTNLQAQQNQLNNEVEQYNADARKADTKAHFLASDLPFELDTTEEITCSA